MDIINFVLDISGFIIILLTLVRVLMEKHEHSNKNKIFLAIIITVIAGIVIDLLSLFCFSAFGISTITLVVCVIDFIPPYLWVSLIGFFLATYVGEKKSVNMFFPHLGFFLIAINIVAIIVLANTGNLYTISNGKYEATQVTLYAGYMYLVLIVGYAVACLRSWKILGTRDTMVLLIYAYIAALSVALDMIFDGLTTQFFAEAVSVFICYNLLLESSLKKKNELIEQSAQSQQIQYEIMKAFGSAFSTYYLVDLMKENFIEFEKVNSTTAVKRREENVKDALSKFVYLEISRKHQQEMFAFVDISTVSERLQERNSTFIDYEDNEGRWNRTNWYAMSRDQDGNVTKAVFAILDITAEVKTRQAQNSVIEALSRTFNSIYYIDMKDYSFVELGVTIQTVRGIIGEKGNAKDSFEMMFNHICKPDYVESMRRFCDLDTLNQRMRGKKWIAEQFEGTLNGWSEGTFIEADRDSTGRLLHVIWGTRDVNEQRELLLKSHTDALTGFFNRRAYEEDISKYAEKSFEEDLVYVAMDVNSLKFVNDNFGHDAGDELLKGAATCISKEFGSFGKLYRIGGDEFIAILRIPKEKLPDIKQALEKRISMWSGQLVRNLSVSFGYVVICDEKNVTSVKELIKLADNRMYEEKSNYYKTSGIDRRANNRA